MAAAPPRLPLKLSHLRLVAAIIARGQLFQAAEDLGLTQPAASRMLAEVERLLGAPRGWTSGRGQRMPKGQTGSGGPPCPSPPVTPAPPQPGEPP